MKKIFLFFVLFFLTAKGLTAEQVITVAFIDKINPPLVLNPNLMDTDKPGITIDILRHLEKRLGVEFIYKSMPWARCLRWS